MSDDLGEIYNEGDGARIVVRLSRTATGTRTYTVGMSMPMRDEPVLLPDPFAPKATTDGDRISRLFAIEEVVRLLLDNDGVIPPAAITELPDPGKPTSVRKVQDVMALGPASAGWGGDGWYTTAELVAALGVSRQYVVGLLRKLVEQGSVEYERGGGPGRPSRYRLVTASKSTRKEK